MQLGQRFIITEAVRRNVIFAVCPLRQLFRSRRSRFKLLQFQHSAAPERRKSDGFQSFRNIEADQLFAVFKCAAAYRLQMLRKHRRLHRGAVPEGILLHNANRIAHHHAVEPVISSKAAFTDDLNAFGDRHAGLSAGIGHQNFAADIEITHDLIVDPADDLRRICVIIDTAEMIDRIPDAHRFQAAASAECAVFDHDILML